MDSELTIVQTLALKISTKLSSPFKAALGSPTARNLTIILFTYALVRKFNRILSGYVLNNWTSDTYDWTREIVLLTGGSSGIGKSVAHDLARRGVKVCVADVLMPAETLRMNSFLPSLKRA
jgi:hypothetical protein